MDWVKDAVYADLPIMLSVLPGDVATDITLTVAAVLRNYNWGGQRIRR